METGRDAVLCDVKLRKQIQEKNMEQFLRVGVISSTLMGNPRGSQGVPDDGRCG